MAAQVVDLVEHGHAVGDQAFMPRTVAEVAGDGRGHFLQPAFQGFAQALQIGAALLVVRALALPGGAQAGQGGLQLGAGSVGGRLV